MSLAQTYQAIADIARYLEIHHENTESAFKFMDGGLTLDIKVALLSECRQNPTWQHLERNYSAVGGCISCPDDDFRFVA